MANKAFGDKNNNLIGDLGNKFYDLGIMDDKPYHLVGKSPFKDILIKPSGSEKLDIIGTMPYKIDMTPKDNRTEIQKIIESNVTNGSSCVSRYPDVFLSFHSDKSFFAKYGPDNTNFDLQACLGRKELEQGTNKFKKISIELKIMDLKEAKRRLGDSKFDYDTPEKIEKLFSKNGSPLLWQNPLIGYQSTIFYMFREPLSTNKQFS